MKQFKRSLDQGVHVITLPINQSMTLCQLFPKQLSGSYIETLDASGEWIDKEVVLYQNNRFLVANSYQTLFPLQTLRLTLKRDIEIDWQWQFISHSGLEQETISNTSGFDFSKALYLAQLSKLVYSNETDIIDTLKQQYQFDEAFYSSKTSHQGYFNRGIVKLLYTFVRGSKSIVDLQFSYSKKMDELTGKQLIVVAFKGSHEPQDWMTNFSLKDTNFYNRGMVHKGFYQSMKIFLKILRSENNNIANATFNDLFNDIKRFNETSNIIITGHSLGGALATLSACYLLEMGVSRENISVYSFGAPPVGTQAFCDFYEGKLNVYRVINEQDVIPKLDKISNLTHLGQQVILPSNEGEVHACEGYIDNLIDCMSDPS